MDNPFENERNGFEPHPPAPQEPVQPVQPAPPVQQPAPEYLQPQNLFEEDPSDVTEEPAPTEEPVPPVQQVQPVQNVPPAFSAEDDSFNPIVQTGVYDDNRFFEIPTVTIEEAAARAAQSAQPPAKSKVNKGLLVVIIVLSALLGAGMFGIVGYSILQAKTPAVSPQKEVDPIFPIPDFTWPNNGGFDDPEIPATTAPAEHKESDYSDKADSSFGGLTLDEKPEDARTNNAYNAEYAFKAASDSVVSVLCFTGDTDDNTNVISQGSGIVLTSDGFVVTNSHVVNDSKTAYAIKVVTADSREYKAGVVGFDSRTDLAVLKLADASALKPAVFGNSDQIGLGEDLIVIGNPGGIDYQNSVTKGIVSAINRDASSRNIVKYIQTDAPINPGNSGGPAVNKYGQVIGVASAKIVDEKYEGIGFCIPSVQVKQICDSLIRNGYVEGRVKIGITGTAVTAGDAATYSIPRGIEVASIDENGPCGGTELKPEDIITEFDGKAITSFAEMYEALEPHRAGDKAKLKFYRSSDKKDYEIEITLQEDKR
ncbi:MAG: trypsin-like peptidase domain-containing protein [Ruminococcus sp.]|nr:trypsin-like peptidase domain-containing protein [Ruminococcus sp.]